MERITPTNVGAKLNDALKMNDDECNMLLFEMGCDYFGLYAEGDEAFRRSITTGPTGKLLWSWFSNQFYMAASEFLIVIHDVQCDTATRRRAFREFIPRKISSFFPPYAMIKRFNKQQDEQDRRNTGTTPGEVSHVAQ